MTAPDRSVKIEPNPFAGGSSPHMNFATKCGSDEMNRAGFAGGHFV